MAAAGKEATTTPPPQQQWLTQVGQQWLARVTNVNDEKEALQCFGDFDDFTCSTKRPSGSLCSRNVLVKEQCSLLQLVLIFAHSKAKVFGKGLVLFLIALSPSTDSDIFRRIGGSVDAALRTERKESREAVVVLFKTLKKAWNARKKEKQENGCNNLINLILHHALRKVYLPLHNKHPELFKTEASS